jgi:nucleoside-diphosphate-sugar epimerase
VLIAHRGRFSNIYDNHYSYGIYQLNVTIIFVFCGIILHHYEHNILLKSSATSEVQNSKFVQNIIIMHYFETTCLRYFNVYGPGQDPTSPYAAAIPIFIRKALKNEDIQIFGDGTQTRDFVYVNDVVRANELAMLKGDGMIFNIANGIATSINGIADKIIKHTGSKSTVIYAKERSGDVKHSVADITEISKIGFKPKIDMNEGLKYTIEFFRK